MGILWEGRCYNLAPLCICGDPFGTQRSDALLSSDYLPSVIRSNKGVAHNGFLCSHNYGRHTNKRPVLPTYGTIETSASSLILSMRRFIAPPRTAVSASTFARLGSRVAIGVRTNRGNASWSWARSRAPKCCRPRRARRYRDSLGSGAVCPHSVVSNVGEIRTIETSASLTLSIFDV